MNTTVDTYTKVDTDMNHVHTVIKDECKLITTLQKEGPLFLEKCYEYCHAMNNTDSDKKDCYEKINSYHTMFLNDDEENALFKNPIKKYINHIKISSSKLWEELILFENIENIKNIVIIFSKKIRKFTFEQKINIYTKLFKNDKVKSILTDKSLWFCDTGKQLEQSFIGDIILSIPSDNCDVWENGIVSVHKLILPFLKNKQIRSLFIEWFATITNKNISKMNFTFETDLFGSVSSNNFLVNVMGIVYTFWKNGINNDRLKKINSNYITDKECPINWYEKDTKILQENSKKKKYNFLTQCFFLLLNSIRVSYIPLTLNIERWKSVLENMDEIKVLLENEGSLFSQAKLFKIYKEIKKTKDIINDSSKIMKNYILKKWINNFYDDFVYWLRIYAKDDFKIDDILDNMATYILQSREKNKPKYIIDKDITNLSLSIIQTRNHTRNPEIRFKYFLVLEQSLVSGIHIAMKDFFEGMVVLHYVLETYDSIQINKLSKRLHMYSLMISFIKNGDISSCTTINNIFDADHHRTKIFINIILNDMNYLNDIMDTFEKSLEEMSKESNGYINKAKLLCDCLEHYQLLIKFYRIMQQLDSFTTIQSSDELLVTLSNVIGQTTKRLIGKYNMMFSYLNDIDDKDNEKPLLISKKVIKNIILICNSTDKQNFAEILVKNSISFDIKDFEKCIEYCDNNMTIVKESFKKFIEKCKKVIKDNYDAPEIEYPDKLLDPLTYLVIKNPALLPGMVGWNNMFFERATIMKHILNKKENPYTRALLTIEEFEEFNSRKETIEKINKFKEDLKDFNSNIKNP